MTKLQFADARRMMTSKPSIQQEPNLPPHNAGRMRNVQSEHQPPGESVSPPDIVNEDEHLVTGFKVNASDSNRKCHQPMRGDINHDAMLSADRTDPSVQFPILSVSEEGRLGKSFPAQASLRRRTTESCNPLLLTAGVGDPSRSNPLQSGGDSVVGQKCWPGGVNLAASVGGLDCGAEEELRGAGKSGKGVRGGGGATEGGGGDAGIIRVDSGAGLSAVHRCRGWHGRGGDRAERC